MNIKNMNRIKIDEAIELFKIGKIGIFPTDTAFGIGCVIDNENSVSRLFKMRKRPENKPTPVLVNSMKMAEEFTKSIIANDVKELTVKYWPGGLTLVLPCVNRDIPSLVRGGTDTLGVRMPNHDLILEIIEKVGKPILAPSANFAGEKTPFLIEQVDPSLVRLVDFVLEGDCYGKSPSTVLDCTQKPYKILREGAVKLDMHSR